VNRYQLKSELLKRLQNELIMVECSVKRSIMDQIHKRFTVEQVKVLLKGYCQGTMSRAEVEEMLNISKTQ